MVLKVHRLLLNAQKASNGNNILTTTGPKTVSIPSTGAPYSEDIVFPAATNGETYTLKNKRSC